MNLSQLFTILWARSGWILFCVVIGIGTAAAVSFLLPPTYTATTSVVIGFRGGDPLERRGNAEPLSPGYVATQIDIATSRPVARRVAEELALAKDPDLRARFRRHAGGRGTFDDWAAEQLLKRLDVRPQRESRVVDLRFSAHDPEQAAAAVNAFAQAYIETRLKLDVDPSRRNSTWLQDQLGGLQRDLEQAQAKLTAYQRRYGLVGDGDRLDVETQRLNELATQLVSAQAQRQEAIARQLGVNHPDYQRALAQEEALRREVAEQKARVLQLRGRRDRADVLQHEVESAQRAYDTALQRHSQTSLEGRVEQANVSILSPATVPVAPSSPNVTLNLAVGIVLGFAIGIGAALLREISDRRIRGPRDVESELGIPLLGELRVP